MMHDVIIVGGGPTGVAAYCALVRKAAAKSVVIVDPIPAGLGNVFGERCAADPMLLCNSSNGLTWIDANDNNDFLDFLVERGWPVASEDHVPRYMIGEYCRQRFLEYRRQALQNGMTTVQLETRANLVRREAEGYSVELAGGQMLRARNVLLCTGLEVPKIPQLLQPFSDHPRYFSGAYPASALRDLPKGAHILVLGLRSSAQDAMLVLVRSGHRVTMTSPSGRVSSIRDVFRYPPRSYFDKAAIEKLDPEDPAFFKQVLALVSRAAAEAGDGLDLPEQISALQDGQSRLRDDLALAEAGKTRWADLIFEGLNAMNAMVGSWDDRTRQRIMPAAYEFTSRFVASLPLLSGQRLVEEIDKGTVRLSAVFVESLSANEDGWTVVWADGEEERFDYVVSTSGYHFPRFPITAHGEIRITHAGDLRAGIPLAEIGSDLRLKADREEPECIWALGAATNAKFPVAHLLWLAAQHAEDVASQISAMSDSANGKSSGKAEAA
jgi:uncharacterized NAD(P)/FAD-binding protein YdhS